MRVIYASYDSFLHCVIKYEFYRKIKNVLCANKVHVLLNINNNKKVYLIYIKTWINFIIYCDDGLFKLHWNQKLWTFQIIIYICVLQFRFKNEVVVQT